MEVIYSVWRFHPMMQRAEDWRTRALELWDSTEKIRPAFFFLCGFLWDAWTMVRVDQLLDNIILFGYLILLGAVLAVERRVDVEPERYPKLKEYREWIDNACQFLLGGLLSGYTVFYFRSTHGVAAWIFWLCLFGLMILNEFRPNLYRPWIFRSLLYWFIAFSYFVFAIPVFTGIWTRMSVLFASGVATLLVTVMVWSSEARPRVRKTLWRYFSLAALALTGLMVVLDILRVIPPIPLAVTEMGVYREVESVNIDGHRNVKLTYSAPDHWWSLRSEENPYFYSEGDKVIFFSSLFAPSGMRLQLQHVWNVWDEDAGEWRVADTIDVTSKTPLIGGRFNGYRTWSLKRRVQPGLWRVDVQTDEGRRIASERFTIEAGAPLPKRKHLLVD